MVHRFKSTFTDSVRWCLSSGKQTIFVEPRVRINGTYCHDVLLTEQPMFVMCEILTRSLSSSKTVLVHTEHARPSAFYNGRHRFHFTRPVAPNSQDPNPVDYRIWAEMQQQLYQMKAHGVDKLEQRMLCPERDCSKK